MMRSRPNSTFTPMNESATATEKKEWEVRPSGMIVQKRCPDSESAAAAAAAPIPTIRVKVKHESLYYEIYISSQSTFGELKKLMAERTGVKEQDQKIMQKGKERESYAYLDRCGVRDRSKLVMLVDPTQRLLETRRAAKIEEAAAAVGAVASRVDALSSQVAEMEASISKGKKVADEDVSGLMAQLMNQLVKLDGVVADGEIKLQRRTQEKRVQKHVGTLDVLKIKNAQKQEPATSTKWEMFDSLMGASASASRATGNSVAPSTAVRKPDLLLF